MTLWRDVLQELLNSLTGSTVLESLHRIQDAATSVRNKLERGDVGDPSIQQALDQLTSCLSREPLPHPTQNPRLSQSIRSSTELTIATEELTLHVRRLDQILISSRPDSGRELVYIWNLALRRFLADLAQDRHLCATHARVIKSFVLGIAITAAWAGFLVESNASIFWSALTILLLVCVTAFLSSRGGKGPVHISTKRLLTLVRALCALSLGLFVLTLVTPIFARDSVVQLAQLPSLSVGEVKSGELNRIVASGKLLDNVIRIQAAATAEGVVLDEARFSPAWRRTALHVDYDVIDSWKASTLLASNPKLDTGTLSSSIVSSTCRSIVNAKSANVATRVRPAILLTLENTTGEATGPLTVWLFENRNRVAIGALGPPSIELSSIPAGGCALLAVPIDPPYSAEENQKTPCIRLQRGSIVVDSCPDSGISLRFSTLKQLMRSSIRDLPRVATDIQRFGFKWRGDAGSIQFMRSDGPIAELWVDETRQMSVPGFRILTKSPTQIDFRLHGSAPDEVGGKLELFSRGVLEASFDIVAPLTPRSASSKCQESNERVFGDFVENATNWKVRTGAQDAVWKRSGPSFTDEFSARLTLSVSGSILRAFDTSSGCEYVGQMVTFTRVEGLARCLNEPPSKWMAEVTEPNTSPPNYKPQSYSNHCYF